MQLKKLKQPTVRWLCPIFLSLLGNQVSAKDVDVDGVFMLPVIEVTESSQSSILLNRSFATTRSANPIQEIPQSIVVISRTEIDRQAPRSFSSLLQNVSNVSYVDDRDATNTVFKIRGFSSSVLVDLVPLPGTFAAQQSLVNIEQIDVIKGPVGGLFGGGQNSGSSSTGGTIALTTFAPEQESFRGVGAELGRFNHRQGHFDLNQVISEKLGVRIIGEISRSDSETDKIHFRKEALFPSFSWSPDATKSLVVRTRFIRNKTLDYSGLPQEGTLDKSLFALPRDLLITANGQPESVSEQVGVNVQWVQKINDQVSFSLVAAQNNLSLNQYGVIAITPYPEPPSYFLAGAQLWQKWKSFYISPSLKSSFEFLSWRHNINLGVDYERTKDDAFMAYSNGEEMLLTQTPIDLLNPQWPDWVEPDLQDVSKQKNTYTTKQLFLQDEMSVNDWRFLVSLRYADFEVNGLNTQDQKKKTSSSKELIPRAGIVYVVNPHFSIFAGHSQNARIPNIMVYGDIPKTEVAKQNEVGLKVQNWYGLSATLSWFDLTQRNMSVDDPLHFGYVVQAGEQQSKGVDIDVAWKVNKAFSTNLALTLQDPKIIRDSNPLYVNKQFSGIPKLTSRVSGHYRVLTGVFSGVTFGGGVSYRSKLPVDSINTRFTPSATTIDAQLSFRTQSAVFTFSVDNLANKKYFIPSAYLGAGHVIPATPRTFLLSSKWWF